MATIDVAVTDTPTDVIAGRSLSAGDYTLQNVGRTNVHLFEADAPVADPSTIRVGHVIFQGAFLGITVEAANAIYLWVDGGEPGVVVVTEAD